MRSGFTERGLQIGTASHIAILKERLTDDKPEGKFPGLIVLGALEEDVARLQRAVFDAVQKQVWLEGALRQARADMRKAASCLSPGMKAGVGEALGVLREADERSTIALTGEQTSDV